ncbi:hypothetical protein N8I77_002801 [Diaporthe amygdali]|uniref:Uncharacterized protein n=1 Tax=Phomopsis amygdali TaxID=1214568 RepID=A0AAD9SU21_PHOAM|nr:hypothetical protein N8I77_002801 [Diaporthe amygdali]
MVSYEPYVQDCIKLLAKRLDEFSDAERTINVGEWMQYFAFDAITAITFGELLGFLETGGDVKGLIDFLDSDEILRTRLAIYPWLTPIFEKFIPIYEKFMSSIHGTSGLAFQQFADGKIESDRQAQLGGKEIGSGPVYMVRRFLEKQQGDPDKGMTDWDVAANAGSNVGAGSDTTALALTTILYYMYRDPAILTSVREEVGNANLPEIPSLQDVQKLPYLQAVIKEAMRKQPGLGLPYWRKVPKGGVVVDGHFIPEGSNVGVNSWVSHYNPSVWGPDADKFRPGRWLEAAAEKGDHASAMDQSFMPFGLGSRTCIGKNASLLEIYKLVPFIARNYDLAFLDERGNPESREHLDLENKWFVKVPHLYAKVTRRP